MRKMVKHTDYQDAAKLLSASKALGEKQVECFQLLESAILEGESPSDLESVDCLHLLFTETRELPGFERKIKEILELGAKKAKTEQMKNACNYVLQDMEGNLVYVGDFEEEAFETAEISLPEAHSRPALPPVLPALGEPESIKPQPLPFSSVVPSRLLFGLTVAVVLFSFVSFTEFVSLRKELTAAKAQTTDLRKELTAVKAQTTDLRKELTAVKTRLVLSDYRVLLAGFKKRLQEGGKPRNSAPLPCSLKDRLHCLPPPTS